MYLRRNRYKIIILCISVVLYCLCFHYLYPVIGDNIASFSILVVAMSGWFFGIYGGIGAVIGLIFLNFGLFYISIGSAAHAQLTSAIPAFIAMLAAGIFTGLLRALSMKVGRQSMSPKGPAAQNPHSLRT